MDITIFQLLAILIGLEAAFYISKASLAMTPETIAFLSGTYYGFNENMVRSLARQNADNWTGIILLVISVIIQAAIPITSGLPATNFVWSAAAALAVAAVVFLVATRLSRRRAQRLRSSAQAIIEDMLAAKTK